MEMGGGFLARMQVLLKAGRRVWYCVQSVVGGYALGEWLDGWMAGCCLGSVYLVSGAGSAARLSWVRPVKAYK